MEDKKFLESKRHTKCYPFSRFQACLDRKPIEGELDTSSKLQISRCFYLPKNQGILLGLGTVGRES